MNKMNKYICACANLSAAGEMKAGSLSVLLLFSWEFVPVATQCVYGDNRNTRCNIPGKPWALDPICLNDNTCRFPEPLILGYSITARIQVDKSRKKRTGSLYVRGLGPGLAGWGTPLELKRTGRLDTWKLSIQYKINATSFACSTTVTCSFNQQAVEFRIYGDENGEDDMIGPNFYFRLPISGSPISSDFLSPELAVFPWFDNKQVTLKSISVSNPHLFSSTATTQNLLALPPSYEFNTHRTYPLVVTFGINELRSMLQVLERGFVYDASVQEVVIVAIEYTGCLLYPFYGGKWECMDSNCADTCLFCWDHERTQACEENEFEEQLKTCAVEKSCGGSGDIILDYIINHLIPQVQVETRHRVEVGGFPTHRINIVGYNEGGLFACYAAIKYPHMFKSAACMSAPFHWPEKTLDKGYELQHIIRTIAENMTHGLYSLYQSQKYYIDTGDRDSYFYPTVDSYLDTNNFVEELKEKFQLEVNVIHMNFPTFSKSSVVDPQNLAFVQRIRYALQVLFPVEGGPNKQFSRMVSPSKGHLFEGNFSGIELTDNEDDRNVHNVTTKDCPQAIVTLPIFLGLIFGTLILSVAVTVLIMCIRESNRRSEDEKAGSGSELNLDSDSSIDLD